MNKKSVSKSSVIKYAGAIVAFLIGSGFASGQEVMQFFTAYGLLKSCLGGLISLALFIWFTTIVLRDARRLKLDDTNSIFKAYCGKIIGTIFQYFTPVFLFMIFVIMLAGAGAVLSDFFELPAIIGRTVMAVICLITVLMGLNKLVDIVGHIGPIIIVFTVFIGISALVTSGGNLAQADQIMQPLEFTKATNFWWLSGITYASFCAVTILPFLAGIGRDMVDERLCTASGIAGSVSFIASAVALSLGMLCFIGQVYGKQVPAVFMSNLVIPGIGIAFAVIMYAGIYTTAVPMLWSVCNKISSNEKSWVFRIAAIVLTVIAYFGGSLPFSTLVNIVYPYMGYLGILLFIGILVRQIRGRLAYDWDKK